MTMTRGDTASTVKEKAGTVAGAGKEVAGTLTERTADVADTAKQEIRSIADQARTEVRTQAEQQGRQAISGLQRLSEQMSALSSGRPEEAGQLGTMLNDAQQRLQSYVGSLQDRGPQALVQDVTGFARRRPGVFLLGAAAAGFAVGRMARAGSAANGHGSDGQAWSGAQGYRGSASTQSGRETAYVGYGQQDQTGSASRLEGTEIPLEAPDPSARVIQP